MKKKLKDVCTIEKGKQIDTKSLDDSNSYRYINGGIKESGFYNDFNTSGEAVLISEGGASCGYVNYVNERFWCGCHCYRLTDINAYPKFLFYSLKASQNGIMELRTGAAMPNIKKESLKNFEVSIIEDKEEQIKIAAHLDKIQSAIDNKKQQLTLLDEAVKSEFVEMFGENPVENGKWKVEKLGDCLYGIENGKSFVCSAESRKDGFPAILKLSSVTYGEFIPEENKALLNNDMFVADAEVHKGDLLFTRKNTPELVGMSAYVFTDEKKLMMPDLIFRLNTRDCLNKIFLWKLINHTIFRGKIRNLASGAAESMSNISKVRLQTLPIPVPPLDLQNQFAVFVQQIDKSKSLVKQQITDLQELLDSKMQQYFA